MATKDYVRRKRPNKKTTKTTNTRSFSWKLAIFSFLLLVGFGAFLYKLNTLPVVEQKVLPKKEIRQAKNNLPPKPKEKWSYIKELENKKISVESKQVKTVQHQYQMQCGAYKSNSQAQERKALIAFQGLESQVIKTKASQGIWYRVVLGPYENKRKAESDRHHLQRAEIEPCAIWLYSK